MSELIEKIIATGTIPAHAPSWAKLDDVQWIQKLDSIIEHPDKYRDSALKQTLLEEANKLKLQARIARITRYPLICVDPLEMIKVLCRSMNQFPDYAISSKRWYAVYPDGREEYICPTGEFQDLGADYDGITEFEKNIKISIEN